MSNAEREREREDVRENARHAAEDALVGLAELHEASSVFIEDHPAFTRSEVLAMLLQVRLADALDALASSQLAALEAQEDAAAALFGGDDEPPPGPRRTA